MKVQVAILGSGIGALWLLYELASRQHSCILLDSYDIGTFASTKNQSWLHTGALYSIIDGPGAITLAPECLEGYNRLQSFSAEYAPDAIENRSGCLYLFDNHWEMDKAIQCLEDTYKDYPEFKGEILSRDEILRREPILKSPENGWMLEHGIRTQDVPFDSHAILKALTSIAFSYNNVTFRKLFSPLQPPTEIEQGWQIKGGDFSIDASIIVCATGVLNPWMFEQVTGSRDWTQDAVSKCLVAVTHQRICNNIIVIRSEEAKLLNLVPFVSGTTINMGAADEKVADHLDNDFPYNEFEDVYKNLMDSLTDFTPGLKEFAPINIHFYTCQKLNNTLQSTRPTSVSGNRHYFWNEYKNLFCFYPGKFTLAPLAANELASVVSEVLGERDTQVLRRSNLPRVSPRPYFDNPTSILCIPHNADDQRFQLRRIV